MRLLNLVRKARSLALSKFSLGTRWSKGNFAPPVFKGLALPILSWCLQQVALRSVEGGTRFGPYALAQAGLVIFLIMNWQWRSVRVLAIGILLNWIPMLANGGYMPITPQAMSQVHPYSDSAQWVAESVHPGSKDIVLSESMAVIGMLGDVFVLASPFPIRVAFSLGDVVILMGLSWTVSHLTMSHVLSVTRGQHESNRSRTSRLCGRG